MGSTDQAEERDARGECIICRDTEKKRTRGLCTKHYQAVGRWSSLRLTVHACQAHSTIPHSSADRPPQQGLAVEPATVDEHLAEPLGFAGFAGHHLACWFATVETGHGVD